LPFFATLPWKLTFRVPNQLGIYIQRYGNNLFVIHV
jgi:hypothetical protein